MRSRFASNDAKFLDLVTWGVLNGVRMFQRLQVTPRGLQVLEPIPEYDFAVIVPTRVTFSALSLLDEPGFPLKLSPVQLGEPVPFWPDLSWGSFATICGMAKASVTENPRHFSVYLGTLPFDSEMPIGKVADASMRSKEFQEAVQPLVHSCQGRSETEVLAALRHSYCLFRRHAVPFWSGSSAGGAGGVGHPFFSNSKYIQMNPNCEILGLVPLVDLAHHSSEPNAAIGFPDQDMLTWLGQEKGVRVQRDVGYFVLQAQRNILPGEFVSVDKNAFFNFDSDTFHAWFGFPYESSATAVDSKRENANEAQPNEAASQQEMLFYDHHQ